MRVDPDVMGSHDRAGDDGEAIDPGMSSPYSASSYRRLRVRHAALRSVCGRLESEVDALTADKEAALTHAARLESERVADHRAMQLLLAQLADCQRDQAREQQRAAAADVERAALVERLRALQEERAEKAQEHAALQGELTVCSRALMEEKRRLLSSLSRFTLEQAAQQQRLQEMDRTLEDWARELQSREAEREELERTLQHCRDIIQQQGEQLQRAFRSLHATPMTAHRTADDVDARLSSPTTAASAPALPPSLLSPASAIARVVESPLVTTPGGPTSASAVLPDSPSQSAPIDVAVDAEGSPSAVHASAAVRSLSLSPQPTSSEALSQKPPSSGAVEVSAERRRDSARGSGAERKRKGRRMGGKKPTAQPLLSAGDPVTPQFPDVHQRPATTSASSDVVSALASPSPSPSLLPVPPPAESVTAADDANAPTVVRSLTFPPPPVKDVADTTALEAASAGERPLSPASPAASAPPEPMCPSCLLTSSPPPASLVIRFPTGTPAPAPRRPGGPTDPSAPGGACARCGCAVDASPSTAASTFSAALLTPQSSSQRSLAVLDSEFRRVKRWTEQLQREVRHAVAATLRTPRAVLADGTPVASTTPRTRPRSMSDSSPVTPFASSRTMRRPDSPPAGTAVLLLSSTASTSSAAPVTVASLLTSLSVCHEELRLRSAALESAHAHIESVEDKMRSLMESYEGLEQQMEAAEERHRAEEHSREQSAATDLQQLRGSWDAERAHLALSIDGLHAELTRAHEEARAAAQRAATAQAEVSMWHSRCERAAEAHRQADEQLRLMEDAMERQHQLEERGHVQAKEIAADASLTEKRAPPATASSASCCCCCCRGVSVR